VQIFYVVMAAMIAYVVVYCLACYRVYFRPERPGVKPAQPAKAQPSIGLLNVTLDQSVKTC